MRTVITLLAILMLSSCQMENRQNTAPFKTLMLRSVGVVETLPNMASFRINLSCLKNSVSEAKECLVEKSNALNDQLQGFGISPKDILTTAINMNKKYQWANGGQQFIGYESSTSMIVTVRSLDSLSGIYSALLENKNLDLGGLSYSHSELESLKNKAYLDALAKANALATELLAKLPETEMEVLKIGNTVLEASMPNEKGQRQNDARAEMVMVSDMSTEPSDISINMGMIKINATLFVEYQIR